MLTTAGYTLQPAGPENRAAIESLLRAVHLPAEDLPQPLDNFLVAEIAGRIVGSVGLELHGDCALLRSLAVDPRQQGSGMGNALCQAAVRLAARKGVRELYLITTTAAPFFGPRGFQAVDRADVPPSIGNTTQFSGVCPASATVMRLRVQ